MRTEKISSEHRCKPDRMTVCWHVEARLASGEVTTFAIADDSSFGAHRTVVFEYPGAEILAVAIGRTQKPTA